MNHNHNFYYLDVANLIAYVFTGAVQSLQGMCRDIAARLYSTNPTTVIQYLSPSLLEQVKERSDQLSADPPCCYDEVFITSKQFEEHPVNLIRNEGQHYSYT